MLEHIIVALIGVLILGGAYLVDVIVGVTKALFTESIQWSWQKLVKSFVRAVLAGVSVVAYVAVFDALAWYGSFTGTNLDILNGFGMTGLVAAIVGGSAYYLISAGKNLFSFFNSKDTKVEVDASKANYSGLVNDVVEHVKDLNEFLFTKKEAVDAHKEFEEKGGQGAVYSVPIGNYDEFRRAVLGNGYDIDGAYGAQCWDGAALLWQQIGRTLSTGGTGAAKGTFQVVSARNANAGAEFEIITSLANVKRGDVVVLSTGQYGHTGFADENGASVMSLLGQNQGGGGNGRPFNVMRIGMSTFIGAFRFKRWIVVPAPAPKPTPVPAPLPAAPAPVTVPNNPAPADPIKVGDTVTAWGVGTADSFGGGATTRSFPETAMKVIGINNGRYGLNQYNAGTPGNVPDVTAWFAGSQVRK